MVKIHFLTLIQSIETSQQDRDVDKLSNDLQQFGSQMQRLLGQSGWLDGLEGTVMKDL